MLKTCLHRIVAALWCVALVNLAVSHAVAADAMPMKKKAAPQLGSSAAFAPDGMLVAALRAGEHVVIQRSADQGRSWSAPQMVNAQADAISADGENRPKLAFAADGALLVSWTRPLAKPYAGEIRLARLEPGASVFNAPLTVHQDRSEITHRFEALLTGGDGRIYLAWIDKRDLEADKIAHPGGKPAYRGAAIYAAVSEDGGRSFKPEFKVADHSCECCRIAAARDVDGVPLIMWRHVFAPNERDHALARLTPDGAPPLVERATFDRWKIDACPHHGPSLAVAADGVRHAVWFNQKEGEGRVWYGRLRSGSVEGQRTVGSEQASHADLAAAGQRVALVWKEFDGEQVQLRAEISGDGGHSFKRLNLAATRGASDQPRLLQRGAELFAFWRSEPEGLRVFALPETP